MMSESQKEVLRYVVKCWAACTLVLLASWYWHYPDISWCLISIILVLTPDGQEAIPLALTRIKGNLVGAASSVLCLVLLPTPYAAISVALVLALVLCYVSRLMSGSRAALAAVIIILLHSPEEAYPKVWVTVGQRLLAVGVGCALALLVTVVVHRGRVRRREPRPRPPARMTPGAAPSR